jgi:signal transduction histidine kinase
VTTPTWSLAHRLAWRLGAVLVAAIGLAAFAVGWRAIVTARALDDTALQAQMRAVAAHLTTAPDGTPRLDLPASLAGAFHVGEGAGQPAGEGGNGFVIIDRQGVRLSSNPAEDALIVPYLPPGDGLFRVPPAPAQPEGMVGFVARAGPWRVAVTQSREQSEVLVRSLLSEFLSTGLMLLVAIGGAAVLIGVWTVSDGLRPLRRASAAAARVDPAQPGLRLPDANLPGEVAPLVAAVNQALARMEAALAAQRRFVGEAAHALRTPLAVLTARLDTLAGDTVSQEPLSEEALLLGAASQHTSLLGAMSQTTLSELSQPLGPLPVGTPSDRQAVAGLRRDVDRMARLIEQMLLMARLDGQPLDVTRPVVLRAVAVEAISALAPLALGRGLELALRATGTPGPITGNHAMLVIALTNLIENALAHAPAGSLIEVELAAPACLTVLDRGPGVPAAEREVIFERFHSGSTGAAHRAGAAPGAGLARGAGVARRAGGAGLGLAIVAGIASAHRGTAWVADREGGGAAFVLALGTSTVPRALPVPPRDAPQQPGHPRP